MSKDNEEITFDEWLSIGMENKFVGPPVCSTHDGIPTTEDEDMAWDEGSDPCIHVLRLYVDKLEVFHPHRQQTQDLCKQPWQPT